MAPAAVSRIPENVLWLSRRATTPAEIRGTRHAAYRVRGFRPYLKAAVLQFSPGRVSTERILRKE